MGQITSHNGNGVYLWRWRMHDIKIFVMLSCCLFVCLSVCLNLWIVTEIHNFYTKMRKYKKNLWHTMSDKFVADYILDGHFCLYTRKKLLHRACASHCLIVVCCLMTVLWRCWLGGRKGIQPVKTEWWGAGVVICPERGVDLHMTQLMPLPLTVSCFSKIQIGFTFLVSAHPGSPGKRAVKWVCMCLMAGEWWQCTVSQC